MAETPLERSTASAWQSAGVVRLRAIAISWPVALIFILVLGGWLRFHGLDWDKPAGADAALQMHPDERFLSMVGDRIDWPSSVDRYFDTARSPLNPYNDPETHSFVYGTFPLFLGKAISTIAGDDPSGRGNSYDKTVVWGRRLTALFDTATIAIVFALGWAVFNRRAGLLAALLYSFAALPIQLAHFWTMDPFLTFFTTLTLLQACLFAGAKRDVTTWVCGVGAGVTLGLAAACKVNAVLFLPVIPLAAAVRIGLRDFPRLGLRWRGGRRSSGHWLSDVSIVLFALAAALVVFRLAQPYAFAGPHFWDFTLSPRWKDDLQREYDFQNGNVDYPPFVQFAGRAPFITPLRNMVLFGLGPALGLAAWASMMAGVVLLFRRRELAVLLPIAAIGAVFAFQGMRFVAFMRYFEPMYPALSAFAGWGLLGLWHATGSARSPAWLSQSRLARFAPELTAKKARWAAGGTIAVVFAATAWWALACQAVYDSTNPRIAASQWIYANAPAGSTLTSEIWDDALPYPLPGEPFQNYRGIETEPYQTDSPEKVSELVYGRAKDQGQGGLEHADYVVISSRRVRDSVKRLPAEYPATIRYYELLDSGELGFEPVATFTSHPTFLGLSVNDSAAEESFTVYDHPEVRIYKKTASWNAARAVALLDEAHPERATNLLPKQGRTNGLQLTPEEARVQQSGGTFSEIFDASGWASQVPWFWWLLWLELAAFAALPWITWLFRALPDRGYGLSKILGLGAVVVPVWMLVAWGGPHFSGQLAWMVFFVATAAGAAIAGIRWPLLREEFREHWRTWLTIEAAFLIAFGAFLLIRYFNPDLWHHPQGGEKPMEIAYLTAVAKSTTLPPYDPWFAGGSMNYYYMGWFFLAVPIRALRLVPEIAFNLGIPTFAALGASVAASTAHNLVAMSARVGSGATRLRRRGWRRPALLAGLFAAVLLIGIGNLDGGHQAIERFQAVNTWRFAEDVPVLGGGASVLGGMWRWLVHGVTLPPFDWWRSSRVHIGQIDITEFPYWSLLFGDLHPHLMDVPFFGLVVALAVAYVATVRGRLRLQPWLIAALSGLTAGLIRTIHTWDYPTAVLIAFGGIAAGQVLAEGNWQSRWWTGVAHATVAVTMLVVPFQPYTAHFEAFSPGLLRAQETTKPNQYFAQFGLFVAFAIAFLAVRYFEELARRGRNPGRNPILSAVNGWLELGALSVFVVGLAAFTATFGVTTIALGAVLEVFLLNLLWLEIRNPQRDPARALVTLVFALAFAISVGVDIVTLKNDIQRMNTVFKFSLQAWQLFALASAFTAWYAGRALWRVRGWRIRPRRRRRVLAVGGTTILAVLLLGASLFVFSGTPARQAARFASTEPTLNGLAYLDYATFTEKASNAPNAPVVPIRLSDDRPLIDWLRTNVEGSPVIAEAIGDLYHWTGRISENTGLPAVIGWDWHQIQQRTEYQALIEGRRSDTNLLYKDPSKKLAADYLRKYNVSYVVVGAEERVHGSQAGLAKLAEMPELHEVFRSGQDVIYRVDQAMLAAD